MECIHGRAHPALYACSVLVDKICFNLDLLPGMALVKATTWTLFAATWLACLQFPFLEGFLCYLVSLSIIGFRGKKMYVLI